MESEANFEPVLAIFDYWDSPRQGIAKFGATNCYFDNIFDEEADGYSRVFRLTPLSDEAFQVGIEIWDVFAKWRRNCDRGQTGRETHPRLGPAKSEYQDMHERFDGLLASLASKTFEANGDFVPSDEEPLSPGLSPWKVKWSTLNTRRP